MVYVIYLSQYTDIAVYKIFGLTKIYDIAVYICLSLPNSHPFYFLKSHVTSR